MRAVGAPFASAFAALVAAGPAAAVGVCPDKQTTIAIALMEQRALEDWFEGRMGDDYTAYGERMRAVDELKRQHCVETGYDVAPDSSGEIPGSHGCVLHSAVVCPANPIRVYWYTCPEARE